MESKIQMINEAIANQPLRYFGPSILYKYRPFDKFAFDMLENHYVFLCPAFKLDDETECDITFDEKNLYEAKTNGLPMKCVDQILEMIRPYSSEENFLIARAAIYRTMKKDGTIGANQISELTPELEKLAPGIDISPLVDCVADIPEKMDEYGVNKHIENLLTIGMNSKKITGICSLAEANDVSYMWDRYADKESGYCIKYDVSDYLFNSDIFPVVYQDQRQTDLILQIVAAFLGQMIRSISGGRIHADTSQYLRLFLTKNTCWSYQKEWRIIGQAGDKICAPKITAIILGNRASEKNKRRIVSFCSREGIECVFKRR